LCVVCSFCNSIPSSTHLFCRVLLKPEFRKYPR
jgi:hypothetical protein